MTAARDIAVQLQGTCSARFSAVRVPGSRTRFDGLLPPLPTSSPARIAVRAELRRGPKQTSGSSLASSLHGSYSAHPRHGTQLILAWPRPFAGVTVEGAVRGPDNGGEGLA
jgi:hypothetical protein